MAYNGGMKENNMPFLTERQEDILNAIIEEYAEMAAPVGSVTLAKLFDVSSATIRAEMARLERLGLIAQPHTSAGRIPTDAGYRYYVNSLVENDERRIEEEERDTRLSRATHAIEVRVNSQTLAEEAIRGAVNSLVELTGNLGLATIGGQLYLSGISSLFSQPEFLNPERIRSVAKLLDNLEPWLREAAPWGATQYLHRAGKSDWAVVGGVADYFEVSVAVFGQELYRSARADEAKLFARNGVGSASRRDARKNFMKGVK